MSEERERGLDDEELELRQAAALPDQDAMSLIDANVAIPIDAAIAANVLSEESEADAEADRGIPDP